LLKLLLRYALHIGTLDRDAVSIELAKESRRANGGVYSGVVCRTVVEDAWHKRDHHGDDGGADNDCKDGFGNSVVLLQNADHAWLTTFTSGGSPTETTLPGVFAHGCGPGLHAETHHACLQGLTQKYKSASAMKCEVATAETQRPQIALRPRLGSQLGLLWWTIVIAVVRAVITDAAWARWRSLRPGGV
jgi:hypothetical protein